MKPRVLHVAPFLWSGAGSVITRLCIEQRRDYRVAVVTSGRSRGQTDWPSYLRALNAARISRFQVDLFDRDPAVFWPSVQSLAGIVRDWRPDIVHAHAGVPACAAALVRAHARRRFALVSHLYSWGTGRPEWMNVMDLEGFAAADRVVCSAEAYRRTLLAAGIARSRIDYVPWGLPLDTLACARRQRAATAPGAPRLGFVGRIEPRKGQLELVQAFARFRARTRPAHAAHLELIGPIADASYAKEITRCIAASRVGGSVTMPGLVRAVAPRVATWDVFVSLSEDEGQGLAVLEAMALGVPVLARRVPGIEDFLQDGVTGVALETGDPGPVAAALGAAWAAPVRLRAIARRASRMVRKRYAWTTTMHRLKEVYDAAA